jgi:hypothetical protein
MVMVGYFTMGFFNQTNDFGCGIQGEVFDMVVGSTVP